MSSIQTSRHTDERGTIMDLLVEPIDSVTWIHTKKYAVRGNHYHRQTRQWTYVLSGQLLVSDGQTEEIVSAGEMVMDPPGQPHAWKALEDTICLVFTKGPRSGDQYESDTYRLSEPLLT